MLTTTIKVEFIDTTTAMKSSGRHLTNSFPTSTSRMQSRRREKAAAPKTSKVSMWKIILQRMALIAEAMHQPGINMEMRIRLPLSLLSVKMLETTVAPHMEKTRMAKIWM
eukprot:Skav215937  [mRNA]  locus=scaffold226:502751:509890:- [translate_table: standard]